jgi:hypothetical protein
MIDYILKLYEDHGCVVFDDEYRDLKGEELVRGADVLARPLAKRKGLDFPCILVMGRNYLNPNRIELERLGPKDGGMEYRVCTSHDQLEGMTAWLCPNFALYYPKPPRYLDIMICAVAAASESLLDILHRTNGSRPQHDSPAISSAVKAGADLHKSISN